ncbi:MAG TPA: hypothetical protein VE665_01215, partial [Hyphomicrobiaceae bacterium]|nr:hypothetical protein [Hyphomicrobiaceae bacterium]
MRAVVALLATANTSFTAGNGAICARCRASRRLLPDVSSSVPLRRWQAARPRLHLQPGPSRRRCCGAARPTLVGGSGLTVLAPGTVLPLDPDYDEPAV